MNKMKTIKIRGNNFAFEDLNSDKKEVIMLIHGHPFNGSMWKYQQETLKSFRLIIPDLKGYGASDYKFEKIYIEEQALDLVLLLDELNISKVHLIGLSMGGQIIVEFCRLFPSRVQSLIICASTPNAETAESYQKRLMLANEINQIGMIEHTKNDIHKYLNMNNISTNSPIYQHLFQMMSETSKEGAIASHRGRAERRDNFKYLKYIKVPSLIIAGEFDYFFSVDDIKKVANEIEHAHFQLIKNVGHLPNMENTKSFNLAIDNFYSLKMKN